MENCTKCLPSSQMLPSTLGTWGQHSREKKGICELDRNIVRRIRQNRKESRGGKRKQSRVKEVGQASLYRVLQIAGKNFRLHPKTNMQLSRDF